MRTRRLLGLVACAAVVAILATAARGQEPVAPAPSVGSSATVTAAPVLRRLARADESAAAAEPSTFHAAPSALAQTLAGEDDFAKIAALEAAVRDGLVAEIPALVRTDLARSPGAAPTIIHGLARLSVQGSGEDAALAASTLARWLKEERTREGNDAAGNVPNLVEALGALGGPEAVDALIELLEQRDGTRNDLAIETLTVQQLAALGDARARAPVTRFLGRVRGQAGSEDTFERELQTEALAAATEALDRL